MTSYCLEFAFQQKKRVKKLAVEGNSSSVLRAMPRKCGGEVGSVAQKRGPSSSPPDTVGANKKTSTPSTSDRTNQPVNLNLAQGKTVDVLRTTTSYFDKDWNTFAQ